MADWHDSIEQLLATYSDESMVRESLHRKAYYRYKKRLTCFQLPIICLSAIGGAAQFLSKSYPHIEGTIVTCTASTSILVSIVSAIMAYLKLGDLKTKHEVAQVAWQNFFNSIKHELSLSRELRSDANEFLQTVKAGYDRLFEISPICDQSQLSEVKKKVRKGGARDFRVPTYLNGFQHTAVYGQAEPDGPEFEDNTVASDE